MSESTFEQIGKATVVRNYLSYFKRMDDMLLTFKANFINAIKNIPYFDSEKKDVIKFDNIEYSDDKKNIFLTYTSNNDTLLTFMNGRKVKIVEILLDTEIYKVSSFSTYLSMLQTMIETSDKNIKYYKDTKNEIIKKSNNFFYRLFNRNYTKRIDYLNGMISDIETQRKEIFTELQTLKYITDNGIINDIIQNFIKEFNHIYGIELVRKDSE